MITLKARREDCRRECESYIFKAFLKNFFKPMEFSFIEHRGQECCTSF